MPTKKRDSESSPGVFLYYYDERCGSSQYGINYSSLQGSSWQSLCASYIRHQHILAITTAYGWIIWSDATQFRIWSTQILKEYLTKGFVLDDERLKSKNMFVADYFDDLLDRIREIRLYKRLYYQKITNIYSECSTDYNKDSETTKLFSKTMQK